MTVRLLAQNGQSIARANHFLSIRRRDRHSQASAHPGPIAQDFEFLDIALSFDSKSFHARGIRRENIFPERLKSRYQEHNIISHQIEHCRRISGFRSRQPFVDEFANCLFVFSIMNSRASVRGSAGLSPQISACFGVQTHF